MENNENLNNQNSVVNETNVTNEIGNQINATTEVNSEVNKEVNTVSEPVSQSNTVNEMSTPVVDNNKVGNINSVNKPKSNNKVLFIIMAVVIVGLVGYIVYSSFIKKDGNDTPKSTDNGSTVTPKPSDNNGGNKTISKASISEKVILDRDGIKVTAKAIDYDGFMGPEIKLLIENKSSKNVTIQARDFSINGIMIDPILSATVNAGKKSNDTITISNSELEMAKITTIKDIEFSLDVFDSESWKDIFKQEGIKLETNATDYVQKYNTDGKVVVDQNNVKIYVLKKDDKDSFWGADIYVYIENNTSQDITIQAKDVSINGFMVNPAFSSTISTGKKIYDTLSFSETELNNNNITDITEIELKFDVFNADSWKDIFKTNTIKISF